MNFTSRFTLTFAFISDTVIDGDQRLGAYGLALGTFGFSFTIGPITGGYLARVDDDSNNHDPWRDYYDFTNNNNHTTGINITTDDILSTIIHHHISSTSEDSNIKHPVNNFYSSSDSHSSINYVTVGLSLYPKTITWMKMMLYCILVGLLTTGCVAQCLETIGHIENTIRGSTDV